MTDFSQPPIFDGHVDVLSRLNEVGAEKASQAFIKGYEAHIDLQKAKIGGFGGGFFALFALSKETPVDGIGKKPARASYLFSPPKAINQQTALAIVLAQMDILRQLEQEGALKICTSVTQIQSCLDLGILAAVLHMEGAEAIDANFEMLDVLYGVGLRSLGPVWSRPNIFGHGVPFAFPSTGDIGPGLTDIGKALIEKCNQMKILIDLSHLNEKGFWDVAEISDAPLVATHSNSYFLCNASRNLSKKQLDCIAQSKGMVGLNFAVGFLRDDGQWNTNTGLDIIMDHLDHLISRLGEDHVGIGSDFDGAKIPEQIGDASGLTNLRCALRAHGFNDTLMEKLCHKNWLAVLKRTWGE